MSLLFEDTPVVETNNSTDVAHSFLVTVGNDAMKALNITMATLYLG
jgi:hypothetical protein